MRLFLVDYCAQGPVRGYFKMGFDNSSYDFFLSFFMSGESVGSRTV